MRGVVAILATLKFSTSPKKLGLTLIRVSIKIMIKNIGFMSFTAKYGKNFILSAFVKIPKGFEEPVLCKKIRWIKTKAATKIGIIKWRERNRFKVGWETEKFPHNHWVISLPMYGIAVSILVITVAPQNDIWPQGSTYPMNAAPIVANKIITPEDHTIGIFIGELK